MRKKDLLNKTVEHIDIKAINSVDIINAMKKMSFSARDLANAADIYNRMLKEKKCAIILTLAGSTSAAGCMQVYVDLVKNNMVDAIVATGASIVDMDFFEQMVYAEATTALPLLASYAYHKGNWKKRKKWRLARIFNTQK